MGTATLPDWLSAAAAWVACAISLAAAGFSWREWRRINRKIGMLEDASAAAEVLPAWYTSRMMTDYWLFGLVTVDGRTIAITNIRAVSDNGEWMDVDLATADEVDLPSDLTGALITAIAADRRRASVRISNIVAAVELQTS